MSERLFDTRLTGFPLQTRWYAVAALAIAAYGAGLYYEQNFAAAGCCGLTWPIVDPVQAERIMAQTDPKGLNAAAQQQTAKTVIAARPGDPTGWLRLAHADWLAHGGHMTDAGVRALTTSYLVGAYGGTFTPWRVSLALNNWSVLSAAAQRDAAQEIQTAKQDQYFPATRRAASGIADPKGRIVAILLGIAPTSR